ncbi:MAG: GTP-binding protein [Cytophagales bacterium]
MIETYIITGFLGAGKTTLLNNLIKKVSDKKIAIIENEFGEVNIDSRLVSGVYEQQYELTNGCICCSLGDDLYDVLVDIQHSPILPDVLFIETTGIADVGNVSVLLKSDEVKKHFTLKNVFCVIDAENVEERMKESIEVTKQIVTSDVLILNKCLSVSPDYVDFLVGMFNKVHPFAHIITTKTGDIDDKYLGIEPKKMPKFRLNQHKDNGLNQHAISTFLFRNQDACEIEKLQLLMQMYFLQYPNQLLRLKGIVKSKDKKKVLIQSTGKYVSVEDMGVWDDESALESQLVLIGRDLKQETVERLLKPAFS